MTFKGSIHKRIFLRAIARFKGKHIPYYFLSTIFLLTSSKILWQRASRHIGNFTIAWKSIDIRGVSIQDYALYKLSKDMYFDTSEVNIGDICNARIFNDRMMPIVYSAFEIQRHGMSAVQTNGRSKSGGMNMGGM